MFKLGTRGDTILEVLLAITVVSMVLGGAYVSSNRSLIATRQTQDRVEALKVAEAQVERLKVAINNGTTFSSAPFCVDQALQEKTLSSDCVPSTTGVTYTVSITRVVDLYTVLTTWDDAGGSAESQKLTIVYRVYP